MKAVSRDEADLVLQVGDLRNGRYLAATWVAGKREPETNTRLFWMLMAEKGKRGPGNRWVLDFMVRNGLLQAYP